jgi:hypothetical protein
MRALLATAKTARTALAGEFVVTLALSACTTARGAAFLVLLVSDQVQAAVR